MRNPKAMLKFNPTYFVLTLIFFVTEICITLFVKDDFIRPYFGDILVVILIYCFIKSFLNVPVLHAVIFVLAFSFLLEYLQHLNLISELGLENSALAKTVLGNTFSWEDLLMYLIGAVLILVIERISNKQRSREKVFKSS